MGYLENGEESIVYYYTHVIYRRVHEGLRFGQGGRKAARTWNAGGCQGWP